MIQWPAPLSAGHPSNRCPSHDRALGGLPLALCRCAIPLPPLGRGRRLSTRQRRPVHHHHGRRRVAAIAHPLVPAQGRLPSHALLPIPARPTGPFALTAPAAGFEARRRLLAGHPSGRASPQPRAALSLLSCAAAAAAALHQMRTQCAARAPAAGERPGPAGMRSRGGRAGRRTQAAAQPGDRKSVV